VGERVWARREEKISQPLLGIKPQSYSPKPVTVLTEIPRLGTFNSSSRTVQKKKKKKKSMGKLCPYVSSVKSVHEFYVVWYCRSTLKFLGEFNFVPDNVHHKPLMK